MHFSITKEKEMKMLFVAESRKLIDLFLDLDIDYLL
jgi:hypothetical protein